MNDTNALMPSRPEPLSLTAITEKVFSDVMRISEMVHAASIKPKGLKTVSDVAVVLLKGAELGMTPMQALNEIVVVEGKPTLTAAGIVSLVLRSGLAESWEIIESTDDVCTFETKRRGAKNPVRVTWTAERAEKIMFSQWEGPENNRRKVEKRLVEKDNWRNYRSQMLRSRCSTELARLVYPDVVTGMYSPDEADVFTVDGDSGEVVSSKPAPRTAPPADVADRLAAKRAETAQASAPVDDKRRQAEKALAKALDEVAWARLGPDIDVAHMASESVIALQTMSTDRLLELVDGIAWNKPTGMAELVRLVTPLTFAQVEALFAEPARPAQPTPPSTPAVAEKPAKADPLAPLRDRAVAEARAHGWWAPFWRAVASDGFESQRPLQSAVASMVEALEAGLEPADVLSPEVQRSCRQLAKWPCPGLRDILEVHCEVVMGDRKWVAKLDTEAVKTTLAALLEVTPDKRAALLNELRAKVEAPAPAGPSDDDKRLRKVIALLWPAIKTDNDRAAAVSEQIAKVGAADLLGEVDGATGDAAKRAVLASFLPALNGLAV